jgi:transcriptional regulator with XRE-family HTH domain
MKYNEIGGRLRRLRENISQKEFALKVGIPLRTYQRYESGERIPPGRVLSRVAEICHVTTDYILAGDVESLQKLALTKKSDLSVLEREVETLDKKIIQKLSEKIATIKDVDALLSLAEFSDKFGIDIMALIKKYFSEKYSIENILLNLKREQTLEIDLMKSIIERVEKILQDKKLSLRPKMKANLIISLYDELKTSADKKISNKRILKACENLSE